MFGMCVFHAVAHPDEPTKRFLTLPAITESIGAPSSPITLPLSLSVLLSFSELDFI